MLKTELRQRFLTSKKTGLVFHAEDGRPIDPNAFQKKEFTSTAAAQIGKVRFHDLRHTFGCLKIEQGENVYYVQRQMGHSKRRLNAFLLIGFTCTTTRLRHQVNRDLRLLEKNTRQSK